MFVLLEKYTTCASEMLRVLRKTQPSTTTKWKMYPKWNEIKIKGEKINKRPPSYV